MYNEPTGWKWESYSTQQVVAVNRPQTVTREMFHEKGEEMKYKVVPVDVAVLEEQGLREVVRRVETVINEEAANGWDFMGLENIQIVVTDPGTKGCFGIGARPETSRITRFDMAVFRQ